MDDDLLDNKEESAEGATNNSAGNWWNYFRCPRRHAAVVGCIAVVAAVVGLAAASRPLLLAARNRRGQSSFSRFGWVMRNDEPLARYTLEVFKVPSSSPSQSVTQSPGTASGFLVFDDALSHRGRGWSSSEVEGEWGELTAYGRSCDDSDDRVDHTLYEIHWNTKDGVEVNTTISGNRYDLSDGCVFLIATYNNCTPVQVQQLAIDFSSLSFDDRESTDASVLYLVEETPQIADFIEFVSSK